MKLVGAQHPAAEALDELPGKANYFIGNDPKRWRTNVPTYAKVRYRDVYPGVDVVYYGNQRQVEHDFVVAPGADPQTIRLRFEGVDKLSTDASGNLVLEANGSELLMASPVAYQEADGNRDPIEGRYQRSRIHAWGVRLEPTPDHRPCARLLHLPRRGRARRRLWHRGGLPRQRLRDGLDLLDQLDQLPDHSGGLPDRPPGPLRRLRDEAQPHRLRPRLLHLPRWERFGPRPRHRGGLPRQRLRNGRGPLGQLPDHLGGLADRLGRRR